MHTQSLSILLGSTLFVAAMVGIRTQSSLNPGAPEFFPDDYHSQQITQVLSLVNYNCQYFLSSPMFSTPNPNPPSYYYSTSVPSPYICHTNTYYPTNPQNHDLLVPIAVTKPSPFAAVSDGQTHLEHEPEVEPQEVMTKPVTSRGAKRNICFGLEKSRGRGFNEREEISSRGHNRDARKERPKCNGNRNWEKQYCYRRSVRSCRVVSKQHHPVIPLQYDGKNTTVMIRNIPNRFTRDMLMEFLDNHCKMENQKAEFQNSDSTKGTIVSAFDFLYLPMDFEKGANKGYAFVNFTDAKAVWKFHVATHNQPWDVFQSNKIRQIVCARVQGKEELVRHFEKSTFDCESDEYLPVCFSPARDGSRVSVEQKTVGRRITNQI